MAKCEFNDLKFISNDKEGKNGANNFHLVGVADFLDLLFTKHYSNTEL